MMLSKIVKNVTETHTFKNFDMLYMDLPIDKSLLIESLQFERLVTF